MSKSKKKSIQFFITLIPAVLVYFILPDDCPEPAKRTAFVFVAAALCWAFEIIPLYATSLLVVLLEILLLCRPGGILNMDPSGYTVFLVPFSSPVIMLFFGSFVLARAVEKHGLGSMAAGRLVSLFGKKPYFVMLGFMLTTAFLSMWMSNTATTAMMLAAITPLLGCFDEDDSFKAALVLSIAFAANIGGMGTPVGTPPNAVAIGLLRQSGIYINFLSWMMMAIPLVLVLLIAASFILIMMFRPKYEQLSFEIKSAAVLNKSGIQVVLIVSMTVVLWLTSTWHGLPESLVALLAVGILAVSGLIQDKDFRQIDWDILILMWGGLALGKGMEISGLTEWIVNRPFLQGSGLTLITAFLLLGVLLSTVISNTATANLIIPVAIALPGVESLTLAVIVALSCSMAMALPISTPPNAMAFSTDVIKSTEMFKSGIIITLLAAALVLLGYRFIFALTLGIHF